MKGCFEGFFLRGFWGWLSEAIFDVILYCFVVAPKYTKSGAGAMPGPVGPGLGSRCRGGMHFWKAQATVLIVWNQGETQGLRLCLCAICAVCPSEPRPSPALPEPLCRVCPPTVPPPAGQRHVRLASLVVLTATPQSSALALLHPDRALPGPCIPTTDVPSRDPFCRRRAPLGP